MRSMTAFARVESVQPWGELVWELRSVNSRYLEAGFRLPENMRYLEPRFRETLKTSVSRGKVDCSLQLALKKHATENLDFNDRLAIQYIQAAESLSAKMKNPAPLSALDILLLPDVMSEASPDGDAMEEAVLENFTLCVEQLLEGRSREGHVLRGFLEQRLDQMLQHVDTLRLAMPRILAAQREKLSARLQEVIAELDSSRLEQEMVIQAQKMDVDEELDRLQTHIHEVLRVLNQHGVIGRRLDFLMQELNREVNTLSSKSVQSDSTLAAVDMKVLIEQMREQVQNIE